MNKIHKSTRVLVPLLLGGVTVLHSQAQEGDLCYRFAGRVKVIHAYYGVNTLKLSADSAFILHTGTYASKHSKKARVFSHTRHYTGRWKLEADTLSLQVMTPSEYKHAVFRYVVKKDKLIQLPHEKALKDKELLKVVKFYPWKKLKDCQGFDKTYQ